MDASKLVELKSAALPKCVFTDLVQVTADPDATVPAIVEETKDYLNRFVRPSRKCVSCAQDLYGLFGSFRWGLANGEGSCASCGWPARGIIRLESPTLGKLTISNMILQYHPDEMRDP